MYKFVLDADATIKLAKAGVLEEAGGKLIMHFISDGL